MSKTKKADKKTEIRMNKIDWDYNDPMARMPNETTKANAALWDFALMGAGRSYQKLLNFYKDSRAYQKYAKSAPTGREGLGVIIPPTKHLTTIKKWGIAWDWQRRVTRWDVINAQGLKEEFNNRRLQAMEDDWQMGSKLIEKAADLLEALENFKQDETTEIVDEATGETIRVITIKFGTTLSQIARALKVGSDLKRLSADMPTEKFDVGYLEGGALDEAIDRELKDLAELEQMARDRAKALEKDQEADGEQGE